MRVPSVHSESSSTRFKQQRLFPQDKSKPKKEKAPGFSVQNEEVARIILSDPEKHGGEGSALVEWARLVLRKC